MGSHILVIDDQVNLARFIAMELHTEGYQVSVSSENIGELPAIQELNPDLIILNRELRCASGLDICRQLRLAGNQVPIVFITANDEASCHVALELGAQTCLTKPFSMSELLQIIELYLMKKRPKIEYMIRD